MGLHQDLTSRAQALVQKLGSALLTPESKGIGTASPTLYDTAWVSMVSKPIDGEKVFIFPESFFYIYNAQEEDGSWPGDGSLTDAIINTLACLLALKTHESSATKPDIPARAKCAKEYLIGALNKWDFTETERVAYELTIPGLLRQLEAYDILFTFPHRDLLYDMYATKLEKLDWEVIYTKNSSLLHCMEAFVGMCDFDRLQHLLRDGNFMSTPSTTAAYLIHSTKWDERAEKYLRHVIDTYTPHGQGSVPNLWPTTIWETVWSLNAFYDNDINLTQLDHECLDGIARKLYKYLAEGEGVIGLAPETTHDADITARTLVLLKALGHPYSQDQFIAEFEGPTHFKCYSFERNASVTVNSNCLMSLLHAHDVNIYEAQIVKAATYVTEVWWTSTGEVKDKWNTSQWYSSMASSLPLVRLLQEHHKSHLKWLSQELLSKITIACFTMMSRLLESQQDDGSWGCAEETSYALITLANVASLPVCDLIRDQIMKAAESSKEFLLRVFHTKLRPTPRDRIWIDKVTYYVESLQEAYLISALNVAVPRFDTSTITAVTPVSQVLGDKLVKNFSGLGVFESVPKWRMVTWAIGSILVGSELDRVPSLTWARTEKHEHGKGLMLMPYMTITSVGLAAIPISWQGILDILVIFRGLYMTDDYFDMSVVKATRDELNQLRTDIHSLFADPTSFQDLVEIPDAQMPTHLEFLERFTFSLLLHPRIKLASKSDKAFLRSEIQHYFLAAISQCEENILLRQRGVNSPRVGTSHHRWTHAVGADNVAGPVFLAIALCLLGHKINEAGDSKQPKDVFPTPVTKYVFNECMMHYGAFSRLANDLYSIRRDFREANLNSVMFAEFEGVDSGALLDLVKYERKATDDAFEHLVRLMAPRVGYKRARAYIDFLRIGHLFTALYDDLGRLTHEDTGNNNTEHMKETKDNGIRNERMANGDVNHAI